MFRQVLTVFSLRSTTGIISLLFIVFISTSSMLRSSDICIYNMRSHASTTTLNLYCNLYCAKENGYFRVEEFLSEVLLHHKDISWLENNREGSLEYFKKSKVFVLKKESRRIFLGSFRESFLGGNASKL